ncbi:GTP-binding protein [Shigella flexneri]
MAISTYPCCSTPTVSCWKKTWSAPNRASTLSPTSKTISPHRRRAGLPGEHQRRVPSDGKLLLESAEKLLRYKGMLWIEGEPNRLLFRASSASRPPTGTAVGEEKPHSQLVFIGI